MCTMYFASLNIWSKLVLVPCFKINDSMILILLCIILIYEFCGTRLREEPPIIVKNNLSINLLCKRS